MILWLYAFLLQSTLFLGAAWLIVKLAPKMRLRLRETIWSIALLASLLGPTAHTLWPNSWPSLWQLPVPTALLNEVTTAPNLPAAVLGSSDDAIALLEAVTSQQPAYTYAVPIKQVQSSLPAMPELLNESPETQLQTVVILLWVLGSALGLCLFGVRHYNFQRLLRNRKPILDPSIRLALDRLRLAANLPRPIKLTEVTCLGSPIAFGVARRAEICLPSRARQELPLEQVQAMLGHEVAHHMRQDPARLFALNLLKIVFFFQPLLRLAHADLQQTAEEQCDAWGARQNGDRWSMARCLAEVATWLLPADRSRVAMGMAQKKSQLSMRVRHLMDDSSEQRALAGLRRRQIGAAVLALIAAPLLAPQVASAAVDQAPENSDAKPVVQSTAPPAVGPIEGARPMTFLEMFDFQTNLLAQEINGLRLDCGPQADKEPFKSHFASLDRKLQRVNKVRNMLAKLLTLIQLEEGPSSDTTNPN